MILMILISVRWDITPTSTTYNPLIGGTAPYSPTNHFQKHPKKTGRFKPLKMAGDVEIPWPSSSKYYFGYCAKCWVV